MRTITLEEHEGMIVIQEIQREYMDLRATKGGSIMETKHGLIFHLRQCEGKGLTGMEVAMLETAFNDRATLLTERDRLREALETAKRTIRSFHGMGLDDKNEEEMWAIYQTSPEMRQINTALKGEDNG